MKGEIEKADILSEVQASIQGMFSDATKPTGDLVGTAQPEFQPLGLTSKHKLRAELDTKVDEFNRKLVTNTKPDDRQNLKLCCAACVRVRFLKMGIVDLQDSISMEFVTENPIDTTSLRDRHGRRIKEILGTEYSYRCPFCEQGVCIQIEI